MPTLNSASPNPGKLIVVHRAPHQKVTTLCEYAPTNQSDQSKIETINQASTTTIYKHWMANMH